MSRKTEIQVGVTVLLGIATLLWGVTWLSTFAKARVMRVWHVSFEQAGGLVEGNDVQVNGIRMGSVKSLRLQNDHIIVDAALSKEIQLTTGCRVVIRSFGLMGDKVVAVDYRDTGQRYSTRDTIVGLFEKGLPEVMAEVGNATGSIQAVSGQLDSLAVSMNRDGGMARTVENFKRTSELLREAVEENKSELHATLENFAASSHTMKELTSERQAQLKQTLDHFASAAENLDRLSGRLDSLRSSLQNVAVKLDNGGGTLGKLVNDDKLYAELNGSVKSLKALIEDVKAQPKKYFKFSVF